MNYLEKAARMALEALEEANTELEYLNDPKGFVSMRQERIMEKARKAVTALRQALEQPAQQQEPFKPDWVNYRQGVEDGRAEVLEILAQQEPLAWVREHELPLAPGDAFSWVETFFHKTPLYTSPPASKPNDCARSHPHENMDAMCELRTEIARLTNENARLKAQKQEPVDWEAVASDQAMTIAMMKVQLEGLPGAEQLPWNKRPWQQIECPVCGELARAEPPARPHSTS